MQSTVTVELQAGSGAQLSVLSMLVQNANADAGPLPVRLFAYVSVTW